MKLLFAGLIFYCVFSGAAYANTRGIHKVTLEASTPAGEKLSLYNESHALLVGVSKYTAGWPSLSSIPAELDRVQAALETQGFSVTRVVDPNAVELKQAFTDFIDEYGYTEGSRLLFFYSGHGHSDERGRGYLVPQDAPLPENRRGFLRKSLQMSQVMAWARQIDTDHALFLFDSCFSGSIFKAKAIPAAKDRLIRKATGSPVRQFITAGSAGETVPARSVFTPAFVDAIQKGRGDVNGDGYITGSELGLYLSQEVPQYADQSPQYGKIKDYELAQGDFVFFANNDKPKKKKRQLAALQQEQSASALPNRGSENLLWQSAEVGGSTEEYLAYLRQFPKGTFSDIAKARIRRIQADSNKTAGSRAVTNISNNDASNANVLAMAASLEEQADSSRKITNQDRKAVWEQLNTLKWAIENKNMSTLQKISNPTNDKRDLFGQLFKNYKRIEVEILQLSENQSKGAIAGKIRLKRMLRKDGTVAYPSKEYRDNTLVSYRTPDGWSVLQW